MQECGVSTKEHGVHHFYNILHHAFSKADEKLAWFLNMFDHFQMNYDNIWEKAKKPNIKIYNAMVYTTAFFLLIRTNHSSSPQSHLSKFQRKISFWKDYPRNSNYWLEGQNGYNHQTTDVLHEVTVIAFK